MEQRPWMAHGSIKFIYRNFSMCVCHVGLSKTEPTHLFKWNAAPQRKGRKYYIDFFLCPCPCAVPALRMLIANGSQMCWLRVEPTVVGHVR